jgi:hypothetical protein
MTTDQHRVWARDGARQAIAAALDAFPELAATFVGITTTADARLTKHEAEAETLAAKHRRTFTKRRTAQRTFSAAGRKAISDAAKKRWANWRAANRTRAKKGSK